jgi:peroxiredoxin Q/BCP
MVDVNEEAPDFELTDDTEETVRLSDFRGRKVILYFYPKALTKG